MAQNEPKTEPAPGGVAQNEPKKSGLLSYPVAQFEPKSLAQTTPKSVAQNEPE